MKYNVCQFTGHNCFGCCGVNLSESREVSQGIENNTNEYYDMKENLPVKYDMDDTFEGMKKQIEFHEKFKDRYDKKDLDSSGVCLNLIYDDNDNPFCPLHSACNAGFDIRVGYCNTSFECITFKLAQKFDEKEADLFKFFVNSKFETNELDLTKFSKQMKSGHILQNFDIWKKSNNFE